MVEKVLFQFRRSLASLAVRRSRGCQGTHIGVKHITIVRVGYKEIEVAHAAAADDGKEIWPLLLLTALCSYHQAG